MSVVFDHDETVLFLSQNWGKLHADTFDPREYRYGAGQAHNFIVCAVDPAAFFEPARSFADILCRRRGKNCPRRTQ